MCTERLATGSLKSGLFLALKVAVGAKCEKGNHFFFFCSV